MKEATVSVIVPIHNAATYLHECIESICIQTYANLEIILVNDASEDDSEEICKNYLLKDFRIKLINHTLCQGVSKSRNDGINIASGEFIAFVDADDVIEKDFIRQLVIAIDGKDIAITAYNKFAKNMKKKYVLEKNQHETWDDVMFHILCTNIIGGYCFNKLYRRKLIQEILFEQSLFMGEDFLFLMQYLLKCKSYRYIPRALYNYRMNPNSVTRNTEQTRILDIKKISYLDAVNKIYEIAKNGFRNFLPYASYRVVRGNIWVMLQLIYCNNNDRELIEGIRCTIKKHYLDYKKVKCGSFFQKLAVFSAMKFPYILFLLGVGLLKICPDVFKKCVAD